MFYERGVCRGIHGFSLHNINAIDGSNSNGNQCYLHFSAKKLPKRHNKLRDFVRGLHGTWSIGPFNPLTATQNHISLQASAQAPTALKL